MDRIDLCGTWNAGKRGEDVSLKAAVPGCIHTDLLSAGKIPDPYYRDNEDQLMWIGETDWTYMRAFTVNRSILGHEHIVLRCLGLDTFAAIHINGKKIAQTDNQFRTYEFDIKRYLTEGKNTIQIDFFSTTPLTERKRKERDLYFWGDEYKVLGGNYVRKSQCNYGWDWGPMCVTHGIWRPIEIVAWDEGRLTDVHIRQNHLKKSVVLSAHIKASHHKGAALRATATVSFSGKELTRETAELVKGTADIDISITDPKLWWPNGMGDQPLYDVEITLEGDSGVLSSMKKRIGLQTLNLRTENDTWGQSFEFMANGKPFFAKGANWIPADTFINNISDDDYEDLIKAAADANMNMLRVWGGGIYEQDIFYDLCDEYGITVWQDFMFACAAYPAYEDAFLENVEAEAVDNVRRLRHHPCIALWCGNNEIEQGFGSLIKNNEPTAMSLPEYKKLFDKLIPNVVAAEDPDRRYWPSSPHTPIGDRTNFNDPASGDAHLWSVWHGKEPFEWYRGCDHRFNSEFGFQSFPEPRVVDGYTTPEDRNVTSYIMEKHQRSMIGNSTILIYMLDWFKLPTSHDMTLWTSQILQGMAIKYAVENWRRKMPRGMGTLYWQINDCWPVASWASIDYHHNWKALHYMARDFYSPILISVIEDDDKGTAEVHITSDELQGSEGTYSWRLTTAAGKTIANGAKTVKILAQKSRKVETLKLHPYLKEYGERNLILWTDLKVGKKTVSTNMTTFARPKHLELPEPSFGIKVKERKDGAFAVTIKSPTPALWVWPELGRHGATYSDRFFHLRPGSSKTVTVKPEKKMTLAAFSKSLVVRSLTDTYR